MSLVRILYDLKPWRLPAFRRLDPFGFSPSEMQAFINYPFFSNYQYRPRIASDDLSVPTIGKDGFKVALDMSEFKPNEITVKTVNNAIVVEGKSQEKDEEQGFISREILRKYMLPEQFDAEKVKSTLTSDGVLTITAPAPPSNERIVEINHVEGKSGGDGSSSETDSKNKS